jgi:hypothetical protein
MLLDQSPGRYALVCDLLVADSNLLEALAVFLVCVDGFWSVASAGDSTSTVVGIAALLVIPFPDKVTEGKARKSEENECWSHGG